MSRGAGRAERGERATPAERRSLALSALFLLLLLLLLAAAVSSCASLTAFSLGTSEYAAAYGEAGSRSVPHEKAYAQEASAKNEGAAQEARYAESGPIRVVFVSDLHIRKGSAPGGEPARIYRALADRVRAAKPDIILIGGDTLNDERGLTAADAVFSLLETDASAYAVMGNHDYSAGVAAMRALYARHGVRLLMNDAVTWESGGRKAVIYGADDLLIGSFEPPRAPSLGDGPALILCHEPGFMSRLDADVLYRKGTYAFSGHTHGGQATLFGVPLAGLPAESGPYLHGEYRNADTRLYVTRGVGTTGLDIRFLAWPEVVVLVVSP